MKKIVIGILAHVDAGKTTLSENLLYLSKSIRKMGRVDHGDSYLDYNEQEKSRGITIFNSQAYFHWKNTEFTLIDTPGHIDFSSEMERSLSILDYAIIVLSGSEGIQSHSETIWKLLEYYHIPTFIFVNKMDMINADKDIMHNALIKQLSEYCIDFENKDDAFYESLSLVNDDMLDEYFNTHKISEQAIINEIKNRHIFPVIYGSALKNIGIEQLLDILDEYTKENEYSDELSGQVFKITKDKNDILTHIKLTGGHLKVKDILVNNEKVNEIRKYSGNKYINVNEVFAGDVCVLTGISSLKATDTIGKVKKTSTQLSSYMNYRIVLPSSCDKVKMLENLKQLAKEDPELNIRYEHNDIYISLMGEIQIDVLKNLIKERYNVDVEFDQGHIAYKETILEAVEGVGHYEPLRHYAEVHLLLEPLKLGSGLVFDNVCKEDDLDRHYQRLIMTHLLEKDHIGVLIGAKITDMKITLLSGKAHNKHTEGGDFREATYRAVRQGLKLAKSALLEPYYSFRLEIPTEYLSRAIYNLEAMNAKFKIENDGDITIIKGNASVKSMQDYQKEVVLYTRGKGKLFLQYSGYQRCHDEQKIIEEFHYDSERDIENPTSSVFCSHGAGFYVPYDKVYDYMHLPLNIKKEKKQTIQYNTKVSDEELNEIFIRTYGPIKHNTATQYEKKEIETTFKQIKKECLLVDGYNVIFTSDKLSEIAKNNLDNARSQLIDMLSNYQGYKQCMLILVFDAYKVKGNVGSVEKNHNIYIVYTKEAQTADMYIERTTHQMANDYNITVATSDALEQLIVIAKGASRISSRQLLLEIESMNKENYSRFKDSKAQRNYLLEDINKLK